MNTGRVGGKEAFHILVNFALQSGLDPLAHHGPLLARYGVEIAFYIGVDFFPERNIEIFVRPIGMADFQTAIFQVTDAESIRQGASGLVKRLPRRFALGYNAPIDAKRQ